MDEEQRKEVAELAIRLDGVVTKMSNLRMEFDEMKHRRCDLVRSHFEAIRPYFFELRVFDDPHEANPSRIGYFFSFPEQMRVIEGLCQTWPAPTITLTWHSVKETSDDDLLMIHDEYPPDTLNFIVN